MRRVAAYLVVWLCLIGGAVLWRFTYLRGTPPEQRAPLAVFAMIATFVVFGVANVYEHRRLALLLGFRGRGVMGYLRGWHKTMAIELIARDDQIPPQAMREWLMFRRLPGYVFASLIIVLPLLVF